MFKTDPFTGQSLEDLGVDTDSTFEIAKHFGSRIPPNMPFIKGTYAYKKYEKAKSLKTGQVDSEQIYGSKYVAPDMPWASIAYGLGFKLRPQDAEVNKLGKELEYKQELKKLQTKERRILSNFKKYGTAVYKSTEERDKELEEVGEEIIKLSAEYEIYLVELRKLEGKQAEEKSERLNKFKGGEVDVPYTKDEPEDRVDPFTGQPYSDQMARLGLAEGGKPSLAELVLNAIQKDPKRNYSDEEISVLKRHADYVANAESDNIANRIQMGGGPGRGKYQYELSTENKSGQQGAKTAVNRYINFKKNKKLTLTEEDKQLMQDKNPDFSKLSEDMQDAIFYADKAMGKMPITDLVKGNLSQEDAWADYHWAGNPEERQTKIDYFIGKNYMPEEITKGKLNASPDYQ